MVREAVNAAIFGLFICLAWRFMLVHRNTEQVKRRTRGAAFALALLCLGEAGRSALAWFSLSAQINKWPPFLIEKASVLWVVSGAIIMAGGLLAVVRFPSSDETHTAKRGLLVVALVVAACLFISLAT